MPGLRPDMRSQNGSTLIIQLFLVSMIATIAMSASVAVINSARDHQFKLKVLNLTNTASNFAEFLRNDAAWQTALGDPANTSFACLNDGGSCEAFLEPNNPGVIQKIYNPKGEVIFDATALSNGLDFSGNTCQSFSAKHGYGDAACPLRLELTWRPICDPGACNSPMVRINISYKYNEPQSRALNMNNYTMEVVR